MESSPSQHRRPRTVVAVTQRVYPVYYHVQAGCSLYAWGYRKSPGQHKPCKGSRSLSNEPSANVTSLIKHLLDEFLSLPFADVRYLHRKGHSSASHMPPFPMLRPTRGQRLGISTRVPNHTTHHCAVCPNQAKIHELPPIPPSAPYAHPAAQPCTNQPRTTPLVRTPCVPIQATKNPCQTLTHPQPHPSPTPSPFPLPPASSHQSPTAPLL